jgi:hypothetical protein
MKIGIMLDCARNAVRNVKTIKKILDFTKASGMTTLYLYLEDVYEIPSLPYFGYLRGRFSTKELKEIDDYAYSLGLDVIPCIQTLAHLNQMFKWSTFKEINDVNDILLCGEEKTYQFIRKELEAIKNSFRTRYINVGLDEAFMLGKGKYHTKNGYVKEVEIFFDHVKKIHEIAEELGLTLSMWSDMFYRTAARGAEYYQTNINFDQEIIDKIPENIKLIYWDYYHTSKKIYNDNFEMHQRFKNNIGFATGCWTWSGLVPNNRFAIKTIKPGIDAALERNIDEVMITAWGDNGAECPIFAALPAIFYCAKYYSGIKDTNLIKQEFEKVVGYKFDDFMKFDSLNILENEIFDVITHNLHFTNKNFFKCQRQCFIINWIHTFNHWKNLISGSSHSHRKKFSSPCHFQNIK